MTSLPAGHCPVCRTPRLARAENPAFPFCSARCRLLDLGRWLGEEYRVPDRHADEGEDERPLAGNTETRGSNSDA